MNAEIGITSPRAIQPRITTAKGVNALNTWQIINGSVRTSRFVNTKQTMDEIALAIRRGLVSLATSFHRFIPMQAVIIAVKTRQVAF